MLFGYNLDKALWAMLSSYSANRKDLVYFIKTLPKEIIEDVIISINKHAHNTFEPIRKDFDVFPVLKYHYEIDIFNDNLVLKVHRFHTYLNRNDSTEHVKNEEYYCLTLNMFYLPFCGHVANSEYIGSFASLISNHVFESGEYKGIEYESVNGNYHLIGSSFGNLIRCKTGNEIFDSKINFDKRMPEEIYKSDFESDDRVINLIKSNKRGRKI